MMESVIRVLLFLIMLVPTLGNAQKKQNCAICKEENHKHTSPYEVTFNSEWPFLAIGTSLALTGYLIKAQDVVVPYTQAELDALNRNDINKFDRSATYNNNTAAAKASDILFFGTAILPAVFLVNHHTRNDIGSILLITYEVAAINYGITNTVKSIVNRPRPYVYNPDMTYDQRTDDQSRYSYFSGHTSFTSSISFLFAKVITDYHPEMTKGLKISLWSFAALLPATTGYLRIESGKHYPTDVLTGYAVGALTGWLVPHLHKKGNGNISLYPTQLFGKQALGLSLRF